MNREINYEYFYQGEMLKVGQIEFIENGTYIINGELVGGILREGTGILDKNGVEIHTGDVVENKVVRKEFIHEGTISGKMGYVDRSYRSNAIVTYDQHWGAFNITAPNVHERGELTIIGNIYQNPELIS